MEETLCYKIDPQPPYGCEYLLNDNKTHALCFQIGTAYTDQPVCVPAGPTNGYKVPCGYVIGGFVEMDIWETKAKIIDISIEKDVSWNWVVTVDTNIRE